MPADKPYAYDSAAALAYRRKMRTLAVEAPRPLAADVYGAPCFCLVTSSNGTQSDVQLMLVEECHSMLIPALAQHYADLQSDDDCLMLIHAMKQAIKLLEGR